ncbi:putative nuclease HARBI1 [Lucilia cuprina]|nr:putative nuclease HARBI1 [Lucilia cuprina]
MFGSIALYYNYDESSESDDEETVQNIQPPIVVPIETNINAIDSLVVQENTCDNKKNDYKRLYLRTLRDASNVLEFSEERFINAFRINKEVFAMLLDEITPNMKVTYRCTHIPRSIKLAKFLAFLGNGSLKSGEHETPMSKSQMSKIINEMLDVFHDYLLSKWIKLERSQEDASLTKEHYYNRVGIPGVVGCVDNTYIRIKTPDKEVKHLYNNVQGVPSLNVMVICDHNMVITHVDASQPGSYQEDYVWGQSSADSYFKCKYLDGESNTWVLGDSAYRPQPYLLTPYRNPLDSSQILFNEKHNQIRNTISKCLKVLKKRFGCLITTNGLQYTPEKAIKIVNSCCILHNICIAYKNDWLPGDTSLENDIVNDEATEETIEIWHEECLESSSIRNEIANMLPQWVPKETTPQLILEDCCMNTNIDIRLNLRNLRDATNIMELPEERFIRSFHINKEVFSVLLEEIKDKMKATYRSTHTPTPIKLATFLAFIATGFQKSTDTTELASKAQVSRIICEMLDIFEEHLFSKWIKFQQSEEDENKTKDYYYNRYSIPGVVGCVANTHVRIKTPVKEIRHLYKNNKGFTSLNVMMICDHNMLITYLDAKQPGSYQNNYVWEQSSADNYLRTNYLQNKINTWLIGDSSYHLLPYLMTPYTNPQDAYHHLYNEKHRDIRKTIKQCFKVLKTRFSCLNTPTGLQYTPEKAVKIVITCCILHNICISYNNHWRPSDNSQNEEDHDSVNDNDVQTSYNECALSTFIRDEIARNLYGFKTDSYT